MKYYGYEVGDIIFQHDNDTKLRAKSTMKWLEDHGFEVLDWPSQSPDLNPIEHIWWIVKNKLKDYPTIPKNNDELWKRVEDVWNNIGSDICLNIVRSMARRVAAVISAKGGHTKY